MPIYEFDLSDGTTVTVEADTEPTDEQVLGALQTQEVPVEEPRFTQNLGQVLSAPQPELPPQTIPYTSIPESMAPMVDWERFQAGPTFAEERTTGVPSAAGFTPEIVPPGTEIAKSPAFPAIRPFLGLAGMVAPETAATIASSAAKTGIGISEYLTSPQGVTELVGSMSPARLLVFGKWFVDMAKGTFEEAGTLSALLAKPNKTPEDWQAISDHTVSGIAMFLGAAGAGYKTGQIAAGYLPKGGKIKVEDRSELINRMEEELRASRQAQEGSPFVRAQAPPELSLPPGVQGPPAAFPISMGFRIEPPLATDITFTPSGRVETFRETFEPSGLRMAGRGELPVPPDVARLQPPSPTIAPPTPSGRAAQVVRLKGEAAQRMADWEKAMAEKVAKEQEQPAHPDKPLTENQLRIIRESLEKQILEGQIPGERKGVIVGSALEAWADGVIKQGPKMTNMGVDPRLAAAAIVKGAALLERGITNAAEWTAEMIREHGEEIRPFLGQIRRDAEQVRARTFTQQPSQAEPIPIPPEVQAAVTKETTPVAPTKVVTEPKVGFLEGLAARRPTDKAGGIRWDIRNGRAAGLKIKQLYRMVGSNEAIIEINGQRFTIDNIARIKDLENAGATVDWARKQGVTQPASVKTGADWTNYLNKYPKLGPEDFGISRFKPTPSAKVEAPPANALADALRKFEDTGEIETVRDLVDEVDAMIGEGTAPESLQAAVKAFREAVREDFEMAGRSDLEAAENAFLQAVRAKAGKTKAEPEAPPAKPTAAKVDVSSITRAKTESEMLKATGELMRTAKTAEEIAQVQGAAKTWKSPTTKPVAEETMWSSASPEPGKPIYLSNRKADADAYGVGRPSNQYKVSPKKPFDTNNPQDAKLAAMFERLGGIYEAPQNPEFVNALKVKGYDSIIGGEAGYGGESKWVVLLDGDKAKPIGKAEPTAESELQISDKVEGMSPDEISKAILNAVFEGGMFKGLKKGPSKSGHYVVAPPDKTIPGDEALAIGPFKSKKAAQDFLDAEVGAPGAKVVKVSETPSLISKLESLKLPETGAGNTYSLPHPDAIKAIGRSTWNTAIDVAIASVKAGKAIAQAVEDAIAYLRKNVRGLDEAQARANLEYVAREETRPAAAPTPERAETPAAAIESTEATRPVVDPITGEPGKVITEAAAKRMEAKVKLPAQVDVEKLATQIDLFNKEIGDALETGGQFLPKEMRPEAAKGAPAERKTVTNKEINQYFVNKLSSIRKQMQATKQRIAQQADVESQVYFDTLQKRFETAFRQVQELRRASHEALYFWNKIRAEYQDIARAAGAMPQMKRQLPILDQVWKDVREGDYRQGGRHFIDFLRMNLFTLGSWTLDFGTNLVATTTKIPAWAIMDAASFVSGNPATRMMSATRALADNMKNWIPFGRRFRLPDQIESELGTTAGGEFGGKGREVIVDFSEILRTKPELADKLRHLDKLLGAPVRMKLAVDSFFGRFGATAELYNRAYQEGRTRGLKGDELKQFAEEYVQKPPDATIARAVKTGKELKFNRDLSRFEESFSSNLGIKVFVEAFPRWTMQFMRWGGEMVGVDPVFFKDLVTGRATPEQTVTYLTKAATGWGGIYAFNQLFYDNIDANSMEYVKEDGDRVRLAGRTPAPELFFISALLRGDTQKAKAALAHLSLPGAKLLSGEPAGLISPLVDTIRESIRGRYTAEQTARELSNLVNNAIPGKSVLGLIRSLYDPTIRQGIGAPIPGVASLLPQRINPTTGEPLAPKQKIPGTKFEIPTVGGTPFPGATRVLNDIESALLNHGLGLTRPRRTSIIDLPAEDVPKKVRQEYEISVGKYVKEFVGGVIAEPEFKSMEFEDRREVLKQLLEAARLNAKADLSDKYGTSMAPVPSLPLNIERMPERLRK